MGQATADGSGDRELIETYWLVLPMTAQLGKLLVAALSKTGNGREDIFWRGSNADQRDAVVESEAAIVIR